MESYDKSMICSFGGQLEGHSISAVYRGFDGCIYRRLKRVDIQFTVCWTTSRTKALRDLSALVLLVGISLVSLHLAPATVYPYAYM